LEIEQRKAVFSVVYNSATQRMPSISVSTKTNTEGEGYFSLFFFHTSNLLGH